MQRMRKGANRQKSHKEVLTTTGERLPGQMISVEQRTLLATTPGQSSVGLAEARVRHDRQRRMERERLAAGSAANSAYLEALEDKEFVFEIQAVILSQLASEENRLLGICDSGQNHPTGASFAKHAQEAIETLSVLKY